MRSTLCCAIALLALSACTYGQAMKPQQITTTSWHGLSGFFVTPTARQIGRNNLAIGFNESKHSEHIDGQFTDRQVRGVVTYGIADWLEVYFSYHNNMYVIDHGAPLCNQQYNTFGFKVRLMREHPHYWFPEVALCVRDAANDFRDAGPLNGVYNGRKLYVMATKRLFRDDALGRFMDLNAGVTWDANTVAGILGFELTIAHNASLIVESMWDSPYLNSRVLGEDNKAGKYVFNPGIRIYPEQVPNMALDLGFVGDGEFEFSFGASYVIMF